LAKIERAKDDARRAQHRQAGAHQENRVQHCSSLHLSNFSFADIECGSFRTRSLRRQSVRERNGNVCCSLVLFQCSVFIQSILKKMHPIFQHVRCYNSEKLKPKQNSELKERLFVFVVRQAFAAADIFQPQQNENENENGMKMKPNLLKSLLHHSQVEEARTAG
jgi:hypothetical protein